MITEIAAATGQLIHLVDDLLHETQTRRLDAAAQTASDDVQNFKDDLLAHRLDALNLRLGGLQHGILVHLTVAESDQLHAVTPALDGFALLGLYARARAADLAADCADILRATASTRAEGGNADGTNAGAGNSPGSAAPPSTPRATS
jgi:hypothetical protein